MKCLVTRENADQPPNWHFLVPVMFSHTFWPNNAREQWRSSQAVSIPWRLSAFYQKCWYVLVWPFLRPATKGWCAFNYKRNCRLKRKLLSIKYGGINLPPTPQGVTMIRLPYTGACYKHCSKCMTRSHFSSHFYYQSFLQIWYEPHRDKTNKVTVRPVKTQISLSIRPGWSESSLCAQWVAKDPNFLHADCEDSDQTGRMPRLIWIFAGRTCHFVGFVTMRLIYSRTRAWCACNHYGNFSVCNRLFP